MMPESAQHDGAGAQCRAPSTAGEDRAAKERDVQLQLLTGARDDTKELRAELEKAMKRYVPTLLLCLRKCMHTHDHATIARLTCFLGQRECLMT